MASEPGQIGIEASTAKRTINHIKVELQLSGKERIEGLSIFNIKDVSDRFNVWARSLGALQKGSASLDFRIGHDDIFHEVLRLLRQLNDYLSDLMSIAKGERQQLSWSTESRKITADEFSDFELSSDDESSRPSSSIAKDEDEDTTITESSDLLLSANDSITGLMRLSIQIHRSSRKSKFARCLLEPEFNVAADKDHVRQLFPAAAYNDSLVTKLAKANAQRRQWLIYRRQHVEKLGVDDISGDIDVDTDVARATVGPEGRRLATANVAPSLPDTIASLFRRSSTGFSQSKYTETQNELSTVVDGDQRLLVPEPPEYAKLGQPFLCPYCHCITEISGQDSWQRHVHADLSSYICILPGCDEPLFESRLRWMDHMSKAHLMEWRCELCSSVQRSASSMTTHILTSHTKIPELQVETFVEKCARLLEYLPTSSCPLCDYTSVVRRKGYPGSNDGVVGAKVFARHLSRHLEQLALFVLPQTVLVDDEISEDDAISSISNDSEDSRLEETVDAMETEEYLQTLANILADKASKVDDSDLFSDPPNLAMGWQPPHDFTPPAECFDAEDPDVLPTRQEPIFGGDLYTPGWARGFGAEKEGFCGRCAPGRWLNMPDGSYEFHMTYLHGSPASGVPLQRPSYIRRAPRSPKKWEGYCEECGRWMVIRRTDRGWNWYRHWLLDHFDIVQERSAMIIAGAEPTIPANDNLFKVQNEQLVGSNDSSQNDVSIGTLLTYIAQENLEELQLALSTNLENVTSFNEVTVDLGKTLLLKSVYQGSFDITRHLLQLGASIEPESKDSFTVLDLAIDAGFYRIASLLMDHGASLSASREACDILNASLQRAASQHIEVDDLDALQSDAADQNYGLISLAVRNGDIERLRQMLEVASGPGVLDLEEGADTGSTPFLVASSTEDHDIMTLLISNGANINATNRLGWTSLMLAAKRETQATIRFLLENGADVNHHSPDRWTALAEAASRGNNHILKSLLDAGADPESVSQHDWTPLMHVAYRGNTEAVEMLIDAGASVHHGSQRDESPLLLAAASKSTSIVRRLLHAGCSPNPDWLELSSKDALGSVERIYQLGWTPLMLACQAGSLEIARMLIEAGANTKPRSPMYKNATEIARENGRVEIVSFLEHFEAAQGKG